MRIEEEAMFIFKFPYDGTELVIPVRAPNRSEAITKLQKWMVGAQAELSMENSSAPAPVLATGTPVSLGVIPPEVMEMRIDTLLKDLGVENMTDKAKAQTVKNFTKLDFTVANYAKIVTKLEEMVVKEKEK